MTDTRKWVPAQPLTTARLHLEPLRAQHADEAVAMLDDVALYEFIGGGPLRADQLRAQYARQAAGQSPDGSQGWLNWMVRHRHEQRLVGTVQTTLSAGSSGPASGSGDGDELVAELSWIVAIACQGQGYASEAAKAVQHWLEHLGVEHFRAHIHPDHVASQRVAAHLGLSPTPVIVNGEIRWTNDLRVHPRP